MTLTATSPLESLVDDVALECQVFPDRIRSGHRCAAAVKGRRLVAFIARRDLGLRSVEIAAAIGVHSGSVDRHIRDAEKEARSDVFFSALLYSLRRTR